MWLGRGRITSVLRGFREKFCMEVAAGSTEAVQGRWRVHIRKEKGNEKIRDSVGQRGQKMLPWRPRALVFS